MHRHVSTPQGGKNTGKQGKPATNWQGIRRLLMHAINMHVTTFGQLQAQFTRVKEDMRAKGKEGNDIRLSDLTAALASIQCPAPNDSALISLLGRLPTK